MARKAAAISIVFLCGYAVMVLEIIGARDLAKDFGSSFYVWVSQIGVILIALAAGYAVGGALADYSQRLWPLGALLVLAGIVIILIPQFSPHLMKLIIMRHPLDQPIPAVWQKIDPAIGSASIFLLPCFSLAMVCPYMIRLITRNLADVGKISGIMIAASTVGSIAGVFISGYILIDHFPVPKIFIGTGALTVALGMACFWLGKHSFAPSK